MHIDLRNIFRAFKSRNYQLFFSGQLISRIGMWMQRTAVIWVVYSMTQSPVMIGLTIFAEQFPSFICSPLGGTIADRHDRYKVLMITQVVSAIQAAALAILYFSNHHQVWMILSLSILLGVANAFDVPARQPMVNDIITNKEDLPNAIAMNSSLNNLARLVGPALSGFVLARYGAGICFAGNAVSFVAVMISLLFMTKPKHISATIKKKFSADVSEGFKYIRTTREIGTTLLILTLLCFLVITYNTLLPVYAKEIFKGDAATYGYINAFIGAGALISAVYLSAQKPGTDLKKMLFINILVVGAGLILFSHTRNFAMSMLLATICGFGTMSIIPISNTILQVASIPEMRGRVISFLAMSAFGMLPLGSLLVGWISKRLGAPDTILCQGVLAIVVAFFFSNFLWGKRKIADDPKAITELIDD